MKNIEWTEEVAIAFRIGDLEIRWYGIFIMLGFLFAIILSVVKMKWRYKISEDPFYYFIFLGVPLAIIGARFWSCCIGNTPWFEIFNIRKGGLAVEGGVMAVVLAACIFMPLILCNPKYHVRDCFGPTPVVAKCSMWLYFDAVVPTILLGQFIGRWGNYFNGEVYGKIVDDNKALCQFLDNCLPYMNINGHYYLPLFLIEGLINLTGFFIVYLGLEFIKTRKAGDLSFFYFIWYGIVRLCLEPLREEQFTYSLTYYISGVWVAIGVLLIIFNHCFSSKWREIKIWETVKAKRLIKRPIDQRMYFAGM